MDGALIATWPLTDRTVLQECSKLKVVSRMGVGVDSIDLDAATEPRCVGVQCAGCQHRGSSRPRHGTGVGDTASTA